MKVFIRTLGCEKNTVDSEYAAGLLEAAGIGITDDPASADVILVNTCGFIDDAKRESIDVLLGYAEGKKKRQKLFATGCLTQRYGEELRKAMPEIDGYIGVNDYAKLPEILLGGAKAAETAPAPKAFEELRAKRRQLTDTPWTAHIKIAEGCNNICTYCAIPFIRGKYRSRRPEDILKEARELAASGCRELVVIAQDTTAYGCDLGPGYSLAKLLRELCGIDGLRWIRLMYCYEDEITDELIEVIRTEPKVCKY
ncbi:MAG: radical SAM protein, partial [Firmicutes bacterium]|nr:radical SAM protein [Bacillota bacterium]